MSSIEDKHVLNWGPFSGKIDTSSLRPIHPTATLLRKYHQSGTLPILCRVVKTQYTAVFASTDLYFAVFIPFEVAQPVAQKVRQKHANQPCKSGIYHSFFSVMVGLDKNYRTALSFLWSTNFISILLRWSISSLSVVAECLENGAKKPAQFTFLASIISHFIFCVMNPLGLQILLPWTTK